VPPRYLFDYFVGTLYLPPAALTIISFTGAQPMAYDDDNENDTGSRGMRQTGDHSNNLQIGDAGQGNTFNIKQNHGSFRDQPIQFGLDPNLRGPVYESGELKKRSIIALGMLLLPIAVTGLAFYADLLSVGIHFGIPKSLLQFGLFMTPAVTLLMNFHHVQAFRHRPRHAGEYRYMGAGRFLSKETEDSYRVVGFSARCGVPECGGQVFIENAPPREKHAHAYIGACDLSPRGHTYELTRNLKGYFRRFDFRPAEEDKGKAKG
jgi:hypothetical protein